MTVAMTRAGSSPMVAALLALALAPIAGAATPLRVLEAEPRHWRNFHLSSGAVVQLEAAAPAFLQIQELATDIWQTRVLDGGDTLAMDVQVRHDWLEVLRGLPGVNSSTFTVVHPDLLERIESQARARRGNWSAAQSEAERQAARSSRGPENDTFFDEFRPQLEVEQWMQALAERNPALVRYIPTLGPSVESRPIPALAVGGTDDGPAIYFQATLHAREWITTSTTLYIAAAMAESDDPRLRALVAAVRFYIVPVANPDGYVYSWSGPINRMLRKNRAPDPLGVGGLCDGVDLNRNYGYQWNNGPLCSSAIQCLPTYHGSAPNSEPETRATSGFLDEIIAQHSVVLGAIDWHSYSQLILRPYGYSCAPFEVELPPNDAEHEAIGAAMADAIAAAMGMSYSNDPSCDLYAACGTGGDYFRAQIGGERSVVYTMELRPAGLLGGGFVLPDSEIRPTGVENLAATIVYGEMLLQAHNGRGI